MDAPVKNPGSETLTSEAAVPEAESVNKGQQVKAVPETSNLSEKTNAKNSERTDVKNVEKPDVKNSENSEETAAAGVSSHSSVNSLESRKSCAQKLGGTVIPQALSVAEVIISTADEGKGTSNTKESLQASVLSLRRSDSCANEGGSDPDCSVISRGNSQASFSKVQSIKYFFDIRKNTPSKDDSASTAGYESFKTSVIKEVAIVTPDNAAYPSVTTTELSKAIINDRKEADVSESNLQFSISRSVGAGVVPELKQMAYAKAQSESSASSGNVGKDKKEGTVSENYQSEKISTSTPCLLQPATANESDEKCVIQKASSSPVLLPVIKITEVNDVDEENFVSESLKPIGNKTEASKNETVSVDHVATAQLISIDDVSRCDKNQAAARSSDPLIPLVKSEVTEDVRQDEEQKTVFYISSSEIPREGQYQSYEEVSISDRGCDRSEQPSCFGSKGLHGGIILLSIVVAFVGFAVYSLAARGQVPNAFETIGLSATALAFVTGLFSSLYISVQMCFQNRYARIEDVEIVTSIERLMYPDDYNLELGSSEIEKAYRNQGRTSDVQMEQLERARLITNQASTLALLDHTQELKSEVSVLLETLTNQPLEDSAEETGTGNVSDKLSSFESALNHWLDEMAARYEEPKNTPKEYPNLETGSPEIEKAYRNQGRTSDVQMEQLERARLVTNQPSTSTLREKLKSEVSVLRETLTTYVSDKLSSFESAFNHWLDSLAARPEEPKNTPKEYPNLETGSSEIEKAYRNQGRTSDLQMEELDRARLVTNQSSTSALLHHTQKLKSEVSVLLETLSNQSLENSAEENGTGDVSGKLSSFESALNHWLDQMVARPEESSTPKKYDIFL